ncbi:MAG: helix-turn-helix domain-containing protein [Desulfobacterales bacterium]|nr:helix-turn-helix domain-containing protein [Desulfobacterales bacterium]
MRGTLKERREKLGFSLHEIALKTRIRVSFLKAIEEGTYDELPGDVYARGYIKDYAKFLGVPPEQEIDSYEEHLANKKIAPAVEEKKVQPQADRVRSVTLPAISFPRRLMWIMPAALVLLVASCARAVQVRREHGHPPKAIREAHLSAGPSRMRRASPSRAANEAPVKPSPEGTVALEQETRKAGRNLDIVATEAVWLKS